MTVCNMSIEAGAKAGLIALTNHFRLSGPISAPQGRTGATVKVNSLVTDEDAVFDKSVDIGWHLLNHVTWGTNPARIIDWRQYRDLVYSDPVEAATAEQRWSTWV